MGLAVTHVILTIVILDLLRHYLFGKKKFPRYLVVIGGIAGLLPDIDIPISWIINLLFGLSIDLHRLFTHSFAFPLLFVLVAGFLHWRGNMKWAKIGYAVAFGWTMHVLTDCFFGGFLPFLWPSQIVSSCPTWFISGFAAEIDAILLVIWLVHEEIHKKIRDYI